MHWYCNATGEPRYEIPYAGNRVGMKTPTLADARKLNLLPSVTSVLSILDKPGLNRWKEDQAIHAALTHPAIRDDMPYEEMMALIKRDAAEHSKMAMQRGTDIHNAIELAYMGRVVPHEYRAHAEAAMDCVQFQAGSQAWKVEAWIPGGRGYGGKCDLHSPEYLVDFKTKEFTSADVVKGWPEQEVQLVAYDHGFGGPRRTLANVFVSVTEPGLAVWVEWPDAGYNAALAKWQATLECWYAWKGYRPSIGQEIAA